HVHDRLRNCNASPTGKSRAASSRKRVSGTTGYAYRGGTPGGYALHHGRVTDAGSGSCDRPDSLRMVSVTLELIIPGTALDTVTAPPSGPEVASAAPAPERA
ncbi:MAG: hypothetical protein ACI970_000627, partial [Myxococcota bacterium]